MDISTLIGQADLYRAIGQLARDQPQARLEEVLRALGPREEAVRLAAVNQGLLRAVMADARGIEVVPGGAALCERLASVPVAPLFRPDIGEAGSIALLTGGQRPQMPAFSDRAFDVWFAAQGVPYGLGAYGEKRSVYASAQFSDRASPERRKIHLGVDVFAPAGTKVHAPLAGKVAVVAYTGDPLDYGHSLILEHRLDGVVFWTLYGHLAGGLPALCQEGQTVAAGQHVADLGDWHENGGWAAHLHFQIITDRLGVGGNFFGVGHESLWPVWRQISPDPDLLLRLGPQRYTVQEEDKDGQTARP